MRAFEVYSNDRKLCVAGIGDDGVLTAIVNWVAKKGKGDLFLTVGGLVSPVSEHVNWARQDLAVGDTVTVKIVETGFTDVPRSRKRSNPAEDLKNQKRYVRAMAKKLGWKIQAKAQRST